MITVTQTVQGEPRLEAHASGEQRPALAASSGCAGVDAVSRAPLPLAEGQQEPSQLRSRGPALVLGHPGLLFLLLSVCQKVTRLNKNIISTNVFHCSRRHTVLLFSYTTYIPRAHEEAASTEYASEPIMLKSAGGFVFPSTITLTHFSEKKKKKKKKFKMAVTSTYRINVSAGLNQTSMHRPHFLFTGVYSRGRIQDLSPTPPTCRCSGATSAVSSQPTWDPCSHVFTLCGKLLSSSFKNSFPFGKKVKVNF